MKTLLSRFCEEFDAAVRPLLDPLRALADALGTARPGGAAETLPGFQEVSHQLRVLADKVAGQQAYVLIFGPLKSGKSTLMNSIAGAYVSEVTALPAYPCMVYVSHSECREFVVTRYDGDSQTFSGPASMRMQVNRDHAELAARIRAAEEAGRDFDPALHFPEAIRRIDVRVPAPELAHSGAVLVDTPGLYSRMKFGYDRMTRDFRSSAACAVFVVKTDNLFLEQVFAEFNELLDLFSRIFLIVNLDSTKMDLRPDGSLAPSLEREDPARVIEAFETLAMDSRLKAALDERRLSLFPVDLLRAASRRLQRGVAHDDENAAKEGKDDFEVFLRALTAYLNSADYLVAFLGDSLHRARSLLADAARLCRHRGIEELERRADALAGEHAELDTRRAALERLVAERWAGAFDGLERALRERARELGADAARRARADAELAIDAWLDDDRSLLALLDDDLAPLLERAERELARALEVELRARAAAASAGAEPSERAAEDLDALGVRLADLAPSGLVAVLASAYVSRAPLEIDVSAVPVRRSLVDWLLLRRRSAVRRNLLGPDARPDHPLSAGDKRKRLGNGARAVLRAAVERRLEAAWPEACERIAAGLARDYHGAVVAALEERLGALRGQNTARLADVGRELGRVRELAAHIAHLRRELERSEAAIDALHARYSATAPEALTQPVAGDDELREDELVPQPRRIARDDADVQTQAPATTPRALDAT